MAEFFGSLFNVVVDRSPDELIGAVILSLGVSLAMAGLYWIGRRNLRENLMPMIVLMLVANLVSMAVGAGFVAHARRRGGRPISGSRFGAMVGTEAMWTEAIFGSADRNRDGRLTREEASAAADQFVRQSDTEGKGSIDEASLSRALVTTEYHMRSWFRRGHDSSDTSADGPHIIPNPDGALTKDRGGRGPDAKDRVSAGLHLGRPVVTEP